MAGNSIKINPDVNTVSIQPDINKITIVNPEGCSVNVSQPVTNVVRVAGQGLQGPPGPAGPAGPSGSVNTSSLVSNTTFNSFTSSIQSEVDSLTSATSSYVLNSQTGSFTTTSSFNSFTSSIQSEVDSLTSATSSYVLNSQTGSFTTTSSFNSFSSSIHTFTSSIQSEVDSLTSATSSYVSNSQTGSFATTGSNTFIGNQIISGSVNITGSFTSSGLIYPIIDGTDGQVIVTDGAGNLTLGHGEKLHLQVRNDNGVDIPAGTPIYSTGEIGGSERINVRAASGSDASKMPAIGITETTLTTTGGTKDGFAIINGIYNVNVTPKSGTPALGDNIYVHADGGLTTIKPTGSALIQNIGTVLKTNGTVIQGMKVSSIDRTNDVPNLLENQIFFGSGSNQTQQIHISGALDQTVINNITASGDISASATITANAFVGDGSGLTGVSTDISGLVTTSSFNSFTSSYNSGSFTGSFVGDGSGVEGVISSSYALTASYALNSTGGGDAFPYTGSAEITGSLVLTGSYTSTGDITISGDLESDNFSTNGITRVGTGAGDSNTGDLITVLGKDAGSGNSGRQLVGFGYEAGNSNSGNFATTVGYRAGHSNTGPYQSSLGYSAGRNNTGNNLSSLGYTAGFGNSGHDSTLIGWQAGRSNSGFALVAIGHNAGQNNTLDNQFIVRNSTANPTPLIQGNFESGSIGIGLTLPQSNLHVAGDIWASGSNGHITASGNISASGIITGTTGSFSHLQGNSPITVGDPTTFQLGITGSNILLTSSIIDFNTEVSRSAQAAGFGAGGGGSTSPGGSDTQVQFNDGGVFGGDAGFTYNKTTNSITNITNITASGNISASGNIITTEVTASKITGGASNLILGYDGSNNITIENGADFFINAPDGTIEIESADGAKIEVSDVVSLQNPVGTLAIEIGNNIVNFGSPANQLISNTFLSSSNVITTDITASGNISSSATITANAFIGDGSGLTGITATVNTSSLATTGSNSFVGDQIITGSLIVSSSFTSQSLSVVGSGSTVFDVIGSVGTLFSIDDDLTGTLFTANDISGFPVLEASASGDVYIGKSPQSLYTTAVVSSTTAATTHSISSLSTSSYDGAFFEYTVHSGSNARAGNIMSTWNGSDIVYAETTTLDIGNTEDLTAEVVISQSQAQFIVYGANAGYKVKTIIKAI